MKNADNVSINTGGGMPSGEAMVLLLVVLACCSAALACGTFCFRKTKETPATMTMAAQLSGEKTDTTRTTVQEQRIVLHVDGMTCGSCEYHVRKALKKVRGVKDAKVSAQDKQAEVVYDTSAAKPGDLINAVNKAGYKASLPDSSTGG